jgi:hypothetical protein
MIFFFAPLLQQNASVSIDQKNRKRPVEQPGRVHGVFFPAADRAVVLINEDELFGHGSLPGDDA